MEIPHCCTTSTNTVNKRINVRIGLLVPSIVTLFGSLPQQISELRSATVPAGSVSYGGDCSSSDCKDGGLKGCQPPEPGQEAGFNPQETTSNPAPLVLQTHPGLPADSKDHGELLSSTLLRLVRRSSVPDSHGELDPPAPAQGHHKGHHLKGAERRWSSLAGPDTKTDGT